ncbi:hypothetical protein [Thermoactinomyces sp. DSM 45892]|uniref:hypothetical protein n=1 Tax=Thermoactinomyces sp. DSM 45892 TaxID=1882753 RepID=UPI000895464A|nr:hypothetical protein [Thermoactinomyces sp. DSM 45892]SDX94805.1 hypothetical protein SAMN05444416_10178 [Thermoactinomyces sp. DSM 45892]
MLVLMLKEAVERFGTKAQRNCIANGRKWRKESNDCLLKSMKQYYGVVKEEKRGRNKVFVLEEPFESVVERRDQRRNNGTVVPYNDALYNLVLDYFFTYCRDKFISMSLNQWLTQIGFVNIEIISASNNDLTMIEHIGKLKEKYHSAFTEDDIVVLRHFVLTELNRLRRGLTSVFTRLSEENIILYRKEMYACQLEDEEHRALSNLEVQEISNLRKELCLKHGVSLTDLSFKHFHPAVNAFKKEYDELLMGMGIKYYYESHGCVIQVPELHFGDLEELYTKHRLSQIDRDNMFEVFKEQYAKHSLTLATKRQMRKNKSDNKYIVQLKVLEDYVPMWEMLLIFYDLTNHIQPKYTEFD